MKSLLLLASLSAVLFPVFAETERGAGEMKTPGRTWYIAVDGKNENDGKTPRTAWLDLEHALKFLKAGDTLQFGEGVHRTGRGRIVYSSVAARKKRLFIPDRATLGADGKPGAPIRITGVPGGKTILTGAVYYPRPEKNKKAPVAEFVVEEPPLYDVVWEYPSQIRLQRVPSPLLAKEYPGTYYLAPDNRRMTVHFAAEDQQGVNLSHDRVALSIKGNYVLVENLTFWHYREAVFAQQNMEITRQIEHVTIRNCSFFGNYKTGVLLFAARNCLVSGNRGLGNGDYGSFVVQQNCQDNLLTGNWAGPSPETLRDRPPYSHNYAMQKYGGADSLRNDYIGNVLDDEFSFRWKSVADENSRFEDNIVTGKFYAESRIVPVVIRRNLFAGKVEWQGLGRDLWEKDFAGTGIVFEGNVRKKADFKPHDPAALAALELAVPPPKAKFLDPVFRKTAVKYIDDTSAVVEFYTLYNDGWGSVSVRKKGESRSRLIRSPRQGVRHAIGITGLEPDTEYEYQLTFVGRRNERGRSGWRSFRTAAAPAAPQTITVGPGCVSLEEAGQMARPGDTVILTKGRHFGQFVPVRSGRPGREITLRAEKGAVIDGMLFYAPLIDLSGKAHWIVDGVAFDNPAPAGRRGVVAMNDSRDIVVRNCRNMREFRYETGAFCGGHGSRFVIENNIAWGGSYLIMIRGKDHVVRRNTVVNATFFCIFAANIENITIADNIFYRPCIVQKKNPAMLLQNASGKILCDGNVFYSPHKHHPAGGVIRDVKEKELVRAKDLADWRKRTGFDRNGIVADPLFENIDKGDFRLKEGSPAKGKGADIK